jgi:hypothetical protein
MCGARRVEACEKQAAAEERTAVHAQIINLQEHLIHVYTSWGFAQEGGLDQPGHMKYWVKPDLLDRIGFLCFAKSVRRREKAPSGHGDEPDFKRSKKHG